MSDESNNPMDEPLASPQRDENEAAVGESGEPSQAAADVPMEPERPRDDAPIAEASAPEGQEEDQLDDEADLLEVADESEETVDAQPEGEVATPEPQAEEPAQTEVKPAESVEDESERVGDKSDKMDWYILKVQSNREESIKEGLLRRVAMEGLEYYFGDVIVPTEKVTEFKGGKKRVMKRKLYPGYIVVNMEINDDTWFLVRETPGIGDFTGAAGTPTPMLEHEVNRILARQEEKSDEAPKLKINFSVGDRVKINEGTFENFEGEVDSIDQTNGRVTVMINIFGRSTPVELEYWQIEAI